jgi:hypothetical protein
MAAQITGSRRLKQPRGSTSASAVGEPADASQAMRSPSGERASEAHHGGNSCGDASLNLLRAPRGKLPRGVVLSEL